VHIYIFNCFNPAVGMCVCVIKTVMCISATVRPLCFWGCFKLTLVHIYIYIYIYTCFDSAVIKDGLL
jgi:hypothetical protein